MIIPALKTRWGPLESPSNLCSHERRSAVGADQHAHLNLQTNTKRRISMSKVNYLPEGYNNVTPYLVIKGAAKAIDYYKNVFGATVVVRMDGPGGSVAHAELQIGDSRFMLADENPQ